MLKASDNPPIRWPENKSICDFEHRWWVAHTKSRNEKALAHDLIQKDISYFLPMCWRTHSTRGRKLRSLLPLFGGYMFFCASEDKRLEVLRTNRVANIIEVKDQDAFVAQLLKFECALEAGADLTPHKYIKTGQRCQVTSGPLEGMQGIVIQTKGSLRLVLKIDMLGQAASVEVDMDMIETLEDE